jgi:hypothetical protein
VSRPSAYRSAQGIVAHPPQLSRIEADLPLAQREEFRRLDESRVVVGTLGQHLQHILGANDRKQVGFRIAVDGREKNMPARFDQSRASGDGARRIGDMLEHFHAGDDVKAAALLGSQFFGAEICR